MAVIGITKLRNESHIIQDTLDNWAPHCTAGIHVYDDASEDDTADICEAHPGVVEVIRSRLFDPDRERAEWFNRQTVLRSARRFISPHDWIVYFDGDEHLFQFDPRVLEDPLLKLVVCYSFESYITAEDADIPEVEYYRRRWVGPEFEYAPYFYRNTLPLEFRHPDQRNLVLCNLPVDQQLTHGKIRHWGKGLSVRLFEKKCRYYSYIFGPKYAEKWRSRMGRAVHERSDYGMELATWDDVLSGKAELTWRRGIKWAPTA